MSSASTQVAKRLMVGRRMPTRRLEHTLLPKILALPIFASDPLSSVAYSVEAGLVILVQSSPDYRALILPINGAVMAVMLLVVASYRQVVRAYPTSAGSYVVSKENLGPIYGLVAAAALLADYVLTVAVSVSSGVLALVSAEPNLYPMRLWLCFAIVAILVAVNLRGVRETGLAFALPTYIFVGSMFLLIAVGFVRCVGGCPRVAPVPDAIPYGGAAAVGLFAILHSFSSGSSSLTGTESIANGVSAFRRPQGRNAASVLAILGGIAVVLVMGTAFLALKTGARPSLSGKVSVISEIAQAVFGRSGGGLSFMYYVLQFFTLAILVLASNTSFQGFPRLSALLAEDSYVPRQFRNLGDRLVYSNGILILAVLAVVLIAVFDANVDQLIQLYVVGVFVAFTLSQIGMVRYWRRAGRAGGPKAQGWRGAMAINAVGGVATGLVLVIVILTKFLAGAWIVITAIPLMVLVFVRVRRHYEAVARQLRVGRTALEERVDSVIVLYVEDLDAATAEAVGYLRGLRGVDLHAVQIPGERPPISADAWRAFARMGCDLEVLPQRGSRTATLRAYLRGFPRGPAQFVTVAIPELLSRRSLLSALRRRSFQMKLGLLAEPWVVVMDVPVVAARGREGGRARKLLAPHHVEVLVFVAGVHDASVRAINFARSLRGSETRAVFFATGPERVEPMIDAWAERHVPLRLDIVDAPFRDLTAPVLREVRGVTARPDALAIVVIPEVVVERWWQQILHRQRPFYFKRLLLLEDRCIVVSVPFRPTGPKRKAPTPVLVEAPALP